MQVATCTIVQIVKLLDSFEGLLERPIIQDELEKKHVLLVQQYGVDLKSIQELFLAQREEPPIPVNLPPVAGEHVNIDRSGIQSTLSYLPLDKKQSKTKTMCK